MRSKHILHAAAFITAFGLSAAFASLFIPKVETVSTYTVTNYQPTSCFKYKNNSAAATKITALINQDKRNGSESDRAYYDYGTDIFASLEDSRAIALEDSRAIAGYAVAVEEYVDASSAMKAADLPSDFQVEWREHMKAWRDYSDFLNRMKKLSNRAALTLEELKEIDRFHSREIDRTWREVLQNGRSHGANVY